MTFVHSNVIDMGTKRWFAAIWAPPAEQALTRKEIMEQANRKRAHLERILLVYGEQNASKSRLLRAMLEDERLEGVVPDNLRIRARAITQAMFGRPVYLSARDE
jgi:hypothetical protein